MTADQGTNVCKTRNEILKEIGRIYASCAGIPEPGKTRIINEAVGRLINFIPGANEEIVVSLVASSFLVEEEEKFQKALTELRSTLQTMKYDVTNFPKEVVNLFQTHGLLTRPEMSGRALEKNQILTTVVTHYMSHMAELGVTSASSLRELYYLLHAICLVMEGIPKNIYCQDWTLPTMLHFPENVTECCTIVEMFDHCQYLSKVEDSEENSSRKLILTFIAQYCMRYATLGANPNVQQLCHVLRDCSFLLMAFPVPKSKLQPVPELLPRPEMPGQAPILQQSSGEDAKPNQQVCQPEPNTESDRPVANITDKNKAEDIENFFKALKDDKTWSDNQTWHYKLECAIKNNPVYIVQEIFDRAPDNQLKMSMVEKLYLVKCSLESRKANMARFLLQKLDIDKHTMNNCDLKWGNLCKFDSYLCKELVEKFDLSVSCFENKHDIIQLGQLEVMLWIANRFNLNRHSVDGSVSSIYVEVLGSLRTSTPKVFAEFIKIVSDMVDERFKRTFLGPQNNILFDCFKFSKMEQFDFLVRHFKMNQAMLWEFFKKVVEKTSTHYADANNLQHVLKLIQQQDPKL